MPHGPDGYLSERELAVLELLADGRTNAEIAEALVVSEATVRTHVGHIFDKLEMRDRRRLGRTYRRLQSVPPDLSAISVSRQPVPEELQGRLRAFLAEVEVNDVVEIRRIYRAIIIRSG